MVDNFSHDGTIAHPAHSGEFLPKSFLRNSCAQGGVSSDEALTKTVEPGNIDHRPSWRNGTGAVYQQWLG